MGKRDRIKQVFRGLGHSSKKASAFERTSATSGTVLETRLNQPRDRTDGASVTDNAPLEDLWDLATEQLSLEDMQGMSPIMSNSKLDILQHLHTAAVKKRTDCEDQRWKFVLNGRQIILRDVAEKVVVWIDKFKQIGDIAVNFDQVHASLPWAGMTVVESQQMGVLLTGVENMMSLIGRCKIYEALYLKKELPEQEEWNQAVKSLTSALVALYATMLSFLASAIRAYNRGTVGRTFNAIFNPSELISFLDKCQSLEYNVAREVENCERLHARQITSQITRQIQTSSEEQVQRLKHILMDLERPIVRIDSRVAALCERLDSSERLCILEWISGIRFEENHFFAGQERTNGTGEWLLRHEIYREWRTSSASMILWLHGDPGAGKTKLIATVVDDLLETFTQSPNDEAFAYFYCDRNQPDRQEPAMILSSFVRQLSTSRHSSAIPRSTVQLYHQKRQTGFASGKLKLKESQTVLTELFQVYPQVTLVVDALDECDKKTRLDFMDILDNFIADSSKPLKILISSRRDRDIKRHFENGPNLEIRAVDNRDDIAMFVDHAITASGKFWHNEISSEFAELICKTLVEKSGGMFQWVALQIAALRELCSERDIRNRLGKLPESLKVAYDELYDKIQSQKESAPTIANRAFQWVMCSCWPLSPAELVAAVCQDPESDEIIEVDINISIVLGACQNLLVVDQELNVCRFSHLSVQEYFETHHWSSSETDCLVGKVCLSFLITYSTFSEQDTQLTKKEGSRDKCANDILEYACLNWVAHVQRLEGNESVENRLTVLLERFLGSMDQTSFAYRNWHKIAGKYIDNALNRDHKGWQRYRELPLYQLYERLAPCSHASFVIVTFGFYKMLLDWWTAGFSNVNQKNCSGDSLLQLGAMRGSDFIVENLLKKGADVHVTGGRSGSPLQAASYSGVESMVQLFLDKEVDVNAPGGKYGSALQAASYFGHESVVQLLLDEGVNVNKPGGVYGSALQAASYRGHNFLVQLLLDKGADVNVPGGEWGSTLQAASFSGHESVVQLLLDKGADVNTPGGRYGSVLHAASFSGHESVVQRLLDKGADVNTPGGRYDSVLHTASFRGHKSVVQLLLDKGADVNTPGGRYGSALQAASYRGHKSVVQLLLDKEADVNAPGGIYGTALQAALSSGNELVVQLLLDKGADVNAPGGEYGSPLEAAFSSGNESLVQLLQGKRADVKLSDEK